MWKGILQNLRLLMMLIQVIIHMPFCNIFNNYVVLFCIRFYFQFTASIPIFPGDIIIMATDGLYDNIGKIFLKDF